MGLVVNVIEFFETIETFKLIDSRKIIYLYAFLNGKI